MSPETIDLRGDNVLSVVLRTIVVYGVSLAAVRLGSRRFLSESSAFDIVVAIMLGSVMSKAISDSSRLWPTLLSGAILVAVHWLIAALSYRFGWLGPLVKGLPTLLVRDGKVDRDAMRRAGVSDHDLEQAIRSHARRTDPSEIRLAVLERDGSISVIPAEPEPVVLDVEVKEGVETVRLRLE